MRKRKATESESGEVTPNALPEFAKNQTVSARLLGITRQTYGEWRRQFNDFPQSMSDGREPVRAVADWMKLHGKGPDKDGAKDKETLTEKKGRKLDVDIKVAKRKLSILNKEYVAVTDAQKVIGDMIGEAKKVFLSGPSSLAPQVVGVTIPEAEKLLRDWLNDALSRLHQNPVGGAKPQAEVTEK